MAARKLIFLDIDGTLTPAGTNVPPDSALAAIRGAQEKGHLVFLCTGRNPAMLAPVLKYGFDGLIGSAGGYIKVEDQVIYDHPMTDEQFKVCTELLHKNGVFLTIEAKDATYADENLADILGDADEGNSEIIRWRKALAENLGMIPMNQYDGRPIYKIVFMCQERSQLNEAEAAMGDQFTFVCQEVAAHSCQNGELINKDFDKGRGIQRICEFLGEEISDTYGFGDSMNDLEMIRTVGTSVCMDNGAKALKEISDIVAPSVEEDGLAWAFKKLGLCD